MCVCKIMCLVLFVDSGFASVCQSPSCTLLLCLMHLPDCVGELADAETAGRLGSLLSTVSPHIPLHLPLLLRYKLEGLSCFGPVLLLLWLHRIRSVHDSGLCATPNNAVSSPSQINMFISKLLIYNMWSSKV